MAKQNNNFEYYKPQNGSSLLHSESESDASDSKAMFQLPKRKIVRSRGSGFGKSKRGRKCCNFCCHSVIPLVISMFIIGTLASIGYILLGVNGMRREMELFKIQMHKVQSEEKSDLMASKNLQQRVEKKLASFNKGEEIEKLKAKVLTLHKQVKILNSTVTRLQTKSVSSKGSSWSSSVAEDVSLLKQGMADTGGDIKKLSDDSAEAKQTIGLLTKIVKGMKQKFITLSQTVKRPFPTEPADTLKPFLATTAPTVQSKNTQESPKMISKLLKKVLNGYNELFTNETRHLNSELIKMRVEMNGLNRTNLKLIMKISGDVSELHNVTKKHEGQLSSIERSLQLRVGSQSNSTTDSRILGIVKDILVGLKKHQVLIANLTKRVASIDQEAPAKNAVFSTNAAELKTQEMHTTHNIKTTEATTAFEISTAQGKHASPKPQQIATTAFQISTAQGKHSSPEPQQIAHGQNSSIAHSNSSEASSNSQTMVHPRVSPTPPGRSAVLSVSTNAMNTVNSTEPASEHGENKTAVTQSVVPSSTSTTKLVDRIETQPASDEEDLDGADEPKDGSRGLPARTQMNRHRKQWTDTDELQNDGTADDDRFASMQGRNEDDLEDLDQAG